MSDQGANRNPDIRMVIEEANRSGVSTIMRTVSRIVSITDSQEASARELKEVVQVDPPFATQLLQRANSAYYSPRRKISEIDEAIVWIGFEAFKELALSQSVCELFQHSDPPEGYSRTALWNHSVCVAVTAKMIYRREFRKKGDTMYAAGLLHDIGFILEDQYAHSRFLDMLKLAEAGGISLLQSEEQVFGFTHADAGMALGEEWNLPREIWIAIGYHHTPLILPPQMARTMAMTLFVADHLCRNESGVLQDIEEYENPLILEECLRELGISRHGLRLIVADVREEMRKLESLGLL